MGGWRDMYSKIFDRKGMGVSRDIRTCECAQNDGGVCVQDDTAGLAVYQVVFFLPLSFPTSLSLVHLRLDDVENASSTEKDGAASARKN